MLLTLVVSSRHGHVTRLCDAVADGYRARGGETMLAGCDDTELLERALRRSSAVVLATPTHLGGPTQEFVAFAEWSATLRADGTLSGMWAAGVTCGMAADGGKTGTLTYLLGVALQHSMLWVGLERPATPSRYRGTPAVENLEGARLGVAATLADGIVTPGSLLTAELLGERLARLGSPPARG